MIQDRGKGTNRVMDDDLGRGARRWLEADRRSGRNIPWTRTTSIVRVRGMRVRWHGYWVTSDWFTVACYYREYRWRWRRPSTPVDATDYRPLSASETDLLQSIAGGSERQSEALLRQLENCQVRKSPDATYPHAMYLWSTSGRPMRRSLTVPAYGQYFDDDGMPVVVELYVERDGRIARIECYRIDLQTPIQRGPLDARKMYFFDNAIDGATRLLTR